VHVVVVEDQDRMRHLVTSYLEENGVSTTACPDGETAFSAIIETNPDVVVLDLMLPGLSGTAICKALRAAGNDVPVIMLTARGEVRERVAGLEAGADDYLVKPFALEELHARIQAIARRREEPSSRATVGDLLVDFASRRVWAANQEIDLRKREFDVLATLLNSAGSVVTRERLSEEVWDGADEDLHSNSLEVYVSRVRRHLQDSRTVTITTVRGIGYRLDVTS
jgi:DNA-binding response OmpR family regulator